jgi:hypothetical protein
VPDDKRRKHAVRDRMAAAGETYMVAARALDAPYVHPDGSADSWSITEVMQERDVDGYAGAVAWLEDPGRQTLCEDCGWTVAMACPECSPGCGCATPVHRLAAPRVRPG